MLVLYYDTEFLKQLDQERVRIQFARITLLSFASQPIDQIQGTITQGTLTVNGSASVRRTINLTFQVSSEDLENIDSILSINKNIKIEIGYQNPIKSSLYDDIIWFNCGSFIINSVSSNRSTSGLSITVSGKDKMAKLDGTAGGTLPSSITFHQAEIVDDEGNSTFVYPTIFQIIQEAVCHYGEENINNIIINDVPDTAKLLKKWNGSDTLYIRESDGTLSTEYIEGALSFAPLDDVCYEVTDLTYPGELILNAGQTVVELLDKIVSSLGNYEYYYDVDGYFIFQEKKNYINNTNISLIQDKDYFKTYNNESFVWDFSDLNTISSITKTPKFENIKNDFIVWGNRTSAAGEDRAIRYHLAIDKKPTLDKSQQYMYKKLESGKITGYTYSYTPLEEESGVFELEAPPAPEWREELYRNALEASYTTDYYSYYDEEILAEWRKLFDPNETTWENTDHWNPSVFKDPRSLDYWLDLIDTEELAPYAVYNIGRRTKVDNNKSVSSIMTGPIPDIVVIPSNEYSEAEQNELISYYLKMGQQFCVLNDADIAANLLSSSTGVSAFERIRELLYIHLSYNTTIQLTTTPKPWLEPNNLVFIYDELSNINGAYAITQYSLPLNYSGLMSISLTEATRRL